MTMMAIRLISPPKAFYVPGSGGALELSSRTQKSEPLEPQVPRSKSLLYNIHSSKATRPAMCLDSHITDRSVIL